MADAKKPSPKNNKNRRSGLDRRFKKTISMILYPSNPDPADKQGSTDQVEQRKK